MTQWRSSLPRRWRAARIALRRGGRRLKARTPRAAPPRNLAWQLAAVTGTVGIVLLLLMQLSAVISSKAAGETQSLAPAAGAFSRDTFGPSDGGPPPGTDMFDREGAADAGDAGPFVDELPPEPIPDSDLPAWSPAEDVSRMSGPEPEAVSDVQLDLGVTRRVDLGAQFVALSPSGFDPRESWPAASMGDELWFPFDSLRDAGAATAAEDRSLAAALLGGSADPLEPLEIESAPDGLARFDVSIEKRVPAAGVVFQPLDYEIVVRNTGEDPIPQVSVDELLPLSQRVTETVPAARVAGQSLSWQLRDISPGEVRKLHVRTTPTVAGEADAALVVEATAAVSATTRVAAPQVRLEVLAPEHSTVGRPAKLTFRVTNAGELEADELILRTDLPELLTHPLGRELDYVIGSLAPGETREMTLTAQGESMGTAIHRSSVSSAGLELASEDSPLAVYAPVLSLRREGLKQPPVGEAVVFANHVTNLGDRPLGSLEIVETVPDGFEVVSVGDDGRYDRQTGQIRWELAELAAGRPATLGVTLRAIRPGLLRSVVTARGHGRPDETMQATVSARTVVPISPPGRTSWPRSPVAGPWPRAMPVWSSWPLGGGFRSGCAP